MQSKIFIFMIIVFLISWNLLSCLSKTNNSDSTSVVVQSNKKEFERLIDFIDSTEYIAINDAGYHYFKKKYDCEASDSLIRIKNSTESKLALYAFYRIAFEECALSSSNAIQLIEIMEENFLDTIGVWTWFDQRANCRIHEAAANSVWSNTKFLFDNEQRDFLQKMRGVLGGIRYSSSQPIK